MIPGPGPGERGERAGRPPSLGGGGDGGVWPGAARAEPPLGLPLLLLLFLLFFFYFIFPFSLIFNTLSPRSCKPRSPHLYLCYQLRIYKAVPCPPAYIRTRRLMETHTRVRSCDLHYNGADQTSCDLCYNRADKTLCRKVLRAVPYDGDSVAIGMEKPGPLCKSELKG